MSVLPEVLTWKDVTGCHLVEYVAVGEDEGNAGISSLQIIVRVKWVKTRLGMYLHRGVLRNLVVPVAG